MCARGESGGDVRPTLFVDLAWASERVARMRARHQKRRFLVDALEKVSDDEIASAVGWLVAEPLCGPLGIGPAKLSELSRTPPALEPSVAMRDVEAALRNVDRATPELREPREVLFPRVASLFAKLTKVERAFFVGALTGSLRQGSVGGLMLLALVDLSGLDEETVRRTVMVMGSIPRAAAALLSREQRETPLTALELFRPLAPMLASPAASLDEALGGTAVRLVEWKIDGLRAQVHKKGARVAVFSRQGNDVTSGCASLLAVLGTLAVDSAVVDGEVVLVGPNGVARPFQDTFSALASKAVPRAGDQLRIQLFDCMSRDGRDLLDEPLSTRREALVGFVPEELRMPSLLTSSLDEAKAFQRAALDAGHEGVMIKDLASPYRFGARGRAWQKVKEFTTVDLVVVGAEWGHGRRQGYLSNLHLGARRDDGAFCMVGKTFKGLTDELLRWQTERLRALAIASDTHVVHVRPELVVEIRFNEAQRSRRYPGGVALRFARVVRYREDKAPSEADTLSSLLARVPEHAAPAPVARREKRSRNVDQLTLFEE